VVENVDFARHVTERLPEGVDAMAALGRLRTEQLYLACGCARVHGCQRLSEQLGRGTGSVRERLGEAIAETVMAPSITIGDCRDAHDVSDLGLRS
jgi:hypothetical protein